MAINLKQLTALFAQSAGNEELPVPIRQFAAQLTVLTAHIAHEKRARQTLDGNVAELAQIIIASRPAPAPADGTPTEAPTTEAPVEQTDNEDDAAKAMAAQVLRETEAEVAATAAKAVTPIRKTNGNKIAVEEAS